MVSIRQQQCRYHLGTRAMLGTVDHAGIVPIVGKKLDLVLNRTKRLNLNSPDAPLKIHIFFKFVIFVHCQHKIP